MTQHVEGVSKNYFSDALHWETNQLSDEKMILIVIPVTGSWRGNRNLVRW